MYSNDNRSRMCQGTLGPNGPNGPNGPIARGYAWHTPNKFARLLDLIFNFDLNEKNYL